MIPPIASNFVAGETPAAALEHAAAQNRTGVKVILNLLGEHYDDPANAAADTKAYRALVRDIADSDIDACISVKPSQLGIDIGDDVFQSNYRSIVEVADEEGVFVWCDMEDADTTDITLDTFEEFAHEFEGGIGQCVQSNLTRTSDDLERLADVPGKIRLVKGAYDESPEISYTEKSKVDERYRADLETLFESYTGEIAVGSHDPEMIEYAEELSDEHDRPFEVQMLMGVREKAQQELTAEGREVWQYAPYGERWLSYFWRRLRERKENVLFALRAIVGI
ncbi:MAG: proline dehydrogenase family protein [Halolamina sp.]|uniref:proline dehydrogenase family protein n=1 Tax=Halolamina sp. TaxID=1940283 RepID=UPI002FC35D7F